MTDQISLLEQARKRDPTALAQIYDTYATKIYAYIYRHVGDAHRAEDLTSAVFLKMLEALDKNKFARDALQSWLYRIAHNIIVDDVRKRQRRPTSALHDGLALPPESTPDYMVTQRLQSEELLQAINQLTEDQRTVIILRFGEGLTAPQVANILDKTEEAVRALQRRGLANLRKQYAQNDRGRREEE
ncbi:MAG TPA: sigma-70 family RNA polymerase sigma factor [Caldilineae bacterium]|nr:sigma-70 family RNA polymerase sigma factor [Caldilineae bacterium]